MKKIYLILTVALLSASCEKALERNPLNGPSTGTFPSSEEEALAGVLVSYKNLANSVQQYSPFPSRFTDNLTDIGTVRVGLSNWNYFTTSTLTQTTGAATSLYGRIFKTAGRIHLVLDKMDQLKDKVDEQTWKQFKAELLCLRAYVYDMGCQYYGDIPFIDHCLTLSDNAYPRMPREQVIDRLLKDMDDDLLDALPVQWPRYEWGTCRLGRAAAYTLKARICLNWGRYAEAAQYSKKAMELSEGVYSLTPLDCTYYPDAETEGEPSAADLFGFDAQEKSREWMWAIQYDKLAAANTHAMIYTYSSRVANGAAGCGPSQALMDTFQCTDGKSITASPLYDWKDPWNHRDPRLDLFCLRPNTRIHNVQYTTDPSVKQVRDYNIDAMVNNSDVTGNKSEYGPNGTKGPGGYLWRKFSDPAYYGESLSANYTDDLNVCIMRYAELLLIDAEANIEMEGGDLQRAQSDINQIRQRVKMPKINSLDRYELRSALRYERTVELCAEGFRWFDIRRWKDADGNALAVKVMNGPQYAPAFKNILSNAKPTIDKDWTVSYSTSDTWDGKEFNLRTLINMYYQTGKDELWPLPDAEIRTNSAIGQENQNPGY